MIDLLQSTIRETHFLTSRLSSQDAIDGDDLTILANSFGLNVVVQGT
jgi:hypothetical protein